MKFGKAFERALEEDQIPHDWIAQSIHYKPLKKRINKVVDEMGDIGLTREVIEKGNLHLYYDFDLHGDELEPSLKNADASDETESIRSKKLKMKSDKAFFNALYGQYQSLLRFHEVHEDKLKKKIQQIATMIREVTDSHNRSKTDMYLWREIFNRYIQYKLDLKSHFTMKNLNDFVQNLNQAQLIKTSKHSKRNTKYFDQFYQLNVELIQFLNFENLNTIAIRKIMKKFDKHTSLKSSENLSRRVKLGKSELTTSAVEQVISTDVIKLVPQIDDYLCPICLSIAYKPVSLHCGHIFCARCLMKMVNRRQSACPMCRESSLLEDIHVDYDMLAYMKEHFPKEVEEKKKSNSKEILDERMQKHYGKGECILM